MNSTSPNGRLIGSPRIRRHGIRTALFVALAAVVALMAACGGDSNGSGGGGGGGSSSRAKDENLPGLEAMGLTERQFATHVEAVESRIAACMSQAGFDYVPVDVETVRLAMLAVRIEPGYTRKEYKTRWGYGVSTRFDNRVKEIGLGPNLATLRGLSPEDRAAYERTLYGENTDETFAFAFDEEDFSSTGGCTRRAVERVFTKKQVSGSYVNPKDILIDEDPRIVAANEAWIQCMHDLGYDTGYEYEDQDDIIAEFEKRFDKLVGDDDPRKLTGPRAEQLNAMQREEIAISLADLECQIRHTDRVYRQVETEVLGRPLD
jgi:hypothetical protein